MRREIMIANNLNFQSALSLIKSEVGAIMRRESNSHEFCVFRVEYHDEIIRHDDASIPQANVDTLLAQASPQPSTTFRRSSVDEAEAKESAMQRAMVAQARAEAHREHLQQLEENRKRREELASAESERKRRESSAIAAEQRRKLRSSLDEQNRQEETAGELAKRRSATDKQRHLRKIQNAIMHGEPSYREARAEMLISGHLTESEIDEVYKKFGPMMPNDDMRKKILLTEGVCTTAGHDPYR